jgi:hypothetical protein
MGIKKAKTKEVRRVTAAEPGVATPVRRGFHVERVYLPERTKRTQLFDGPPRRRPPNWWKN